MTFNAPTASDSNQVVQAVAQLGVDEQLALLWFIYEEMGDSVTPAAPDAAAPEIAGGLFKQVKEKSHAEQLQVMRDLVNKASTEISREYGSLSANTKLAFWYFLAQGMDEETIVPMPDDYELSGQAQNLLSTIIQLDFQQQITALRDIVVGMGAEAAPGAGL